jgi:AcrR family transcriptional regulator
MSGGYLHAVRAGVGVATLYRRFPTREKLVAAAANELLITVIDRAKAAGALREDFAGEDLVLLLIATAAVMHVTRADAPEAWRRFVALALDSFSSPAARTGRDSPFPEPPSTGQLTQAMIRLASERGCGEPT